MSYIPPSDSVNVNNSSGEKINPATEETVLLLKRLVRILDSVATVDVQNRQRVVVESAAQTSITIAAAQTLATLTTVTNAVPVGNVATMGGVDPRFEFMELARISYSNGIRSKLSFS